MEIAEFFTTIKTPLTVLHVLSVVFGMGSALVSDLLFTFYSKDKKMSETELKTLRLLSNVVWIALIVITLSGLGIFFSNIPKYIASTKFLVKMSIMAVLLVNGHVLHKFVWKHVIARQFLTSSKESFMRKVAFVCGAISVLSWIVMCILGVLKSIPLSYVQAVVSYLGIVIFGIGGALVIERIEFERKK